MTVKIRLRNRREVSLKKKEISAGREREKKMNRGSKEEMKITLNSAREEKTVL